MSREKSDALFNLIKSLSQSEKRYFKLYMSKNGGDETKTIKLFDGIAKQTDFDDGVLLRKIPELKPSQLSNLKAELFKHVMHSLRLYNSNKIVDLEIRQQIDFAQLLIDRCLYKEGAETLRKAKKQAIKHDSLELLLVISKLEKSVLAYTIDDNNQKRVTAIVAEVDAINSRINIVNQLSNLEAKLNSLYKKVGFIRDERDHMAIRNYFRKNLPKYEDDKLSSIERIHLHNVYIGYFLFIQDFENAYGEATDLVRLFDSQPSLKQSRTEQFIQALNSLLIAQYKLFRFYEFVETTQRLNALQSTSSIRLNENMKAKLFKYYYMHEINRYFMLGDFEGGVKLISQIEMGLQDFIDRLDKHSTIIFYYKFASLYFGIGDYSSAVYWLNKIINTPNISIRQDIHSFARIMHLVAQYEMENYDVLDYYVRSTYRFLAKRYDLRLYHKYILNFLRNLSTPNEMTLRRGFAKLREQLLPLMEMPYERRYFVYFDIISWLESKIQARPVQQVIQEKALQKIALQSVL